MYIQFKTRLTLTYLKKNPSQHKLCVFFHCYFYNNNAVHSHIIGLLYHMYLRNFHECDRWNCGSGAARANALNRGLATRTLNEKWESKRSPYTDASSLNIINILGALLHVDLQWVEGNRNFKIIFRKTLTTIWAAKMLETSPWVVKLV